MAFRPSSWSAADNCDTALATAKQARPMGDVDDARRHKFLNPGGIPEGDNGGGTMYLLATHIPFYIDGAKIFIDESWAADVDLARRYFVPHFGKLHVLGPSLPRDAASPHVSLREVDRGRTDVEWVPSVDKRMTVRQYWPKGIRQWNRDVRRLVADATVVHASVDDPFKPIQLSALLAGIKTKKTTILIGPDMDRWTTLRSRLGTLDSKRKAKHVLRTAFSDAWIRYCARKASVAMLKEGLVYDRYASWSRNPKGFCHSMHSAADVIDVERLEARLASQANGRPLRFGYFGRFIERKGLADSIRILALARARGVDASLHLIGSGQQANALRALAADQGVGEHVRFADPLPYGKELHGEISNLDALLFTPTQEDTPRMVYDAYAAGLPLITSDIPFLRTRAEKDHVSMVFGISDIEGGAATLSVLNSDRIKLANLSRLARQRGEFHTADNWYARRVEWTLEAVALNTPR